MRILPGLLVLCLLVSALPVHAQTNPVTVPLTSGGHTSVDIVQDSNVELVFTVNDGAFGNQPAAAYVTLTCAAGTTAGACPQAETITLAMDKSSSTWSAELAVSTPDLVKGNWTVVATGQSGSSTSNVPAGNPFTLDVTAPTVAKPRLRALNVDLDAGFVPVGKGQKVDVSVSSSIIRSVHYQIDGGVVLPWGSPYSLAARNFVPTGEHTLKVIAKDRVGQTSELSFFVYADVDDPDVSHNIPDRLFQGVPNPIPVTVTDGSNVTVTARVGTQTGSITAGPGTATHMPTVTPLELGEQLVEVTVEDLVGNRVRFVHAVEVVELEVDAELVDAEQTDTGAIPSEDITFRVEARQSGGIIAVPVDVTFQDMVLGQIELPVTGSIERTYTVRLAPGVHMDNLSLEVPADVVEIDPSDNSMEFTLEQFLARVIYRNDVYHIRATANGLPDVAVDRDGKTYPLTLKDRGLATVYAFEVDGVELFWNPATSVTTVPEPQDPDDDGDIPVAPLAWILLALVAIAARRR